MSDWDSAAGEQLDAFTPPSALWGPAATYPTAYRTSMPAWGAALPADDAALPHSVCECFRCCQLLPSRGHTAHLPLLCEARCLMPGIPLGSGYARGAHQTQNSHLHCSPTRMLPRLRSRHRAGRALGVVARLAPRAADGRPAQPDERAALWPAGAAGRLAGLRAQPLVRLLAAPPRCDAVVSCARGRLPLTWTWPGTTTAAQVHRQRRAPRALQRGRDHPRRAGLRHQQPRVQRPPGAARR